MRQLYEYNPTFGYRFVPGLKARIPHEAGGYLIQVNGSGFRCRHEFVPERPASGFRALLFGDSFTAGDGVANGQRFGDLLETRLPGLQVYNFGLSGSGTDQQYLIHRECAGGIEHDVVVLAVLVENIRRVNARYRRYADAEGRPQLFAKPYFEMRGGALTLRHVPVPREPIDENQLSPDDSGHVDRGGRLEMLRQVVKGLGLQDVAQKLTRYQPVPDYADPSGPACQLLRAILSAWVLACGRPVVLVPIPLYQFIEGTSDPHDYQARFREWAAEMECVLHDPLPDLLAYPPRERRGFRFETDVHLTAAGHAALADSLAPTLRRVLGREPKEQRA